MTPCEVFDKLPIEARKAIIAEWGGNHLLDGFDHYHRNFDPLDTDSCDTYKAIREEILKRCSRQ